MLNSETFLNRFENVTESGDQWMVRCPAHKDEKASLAVRFTREGKTLLHCHAGCDTAEVVKALGLEMKDLGSDHTRVLYPPENGVHVSTLNQPIETNKEKVATDLDTGGHQDAVPVTVDQYAALKKLPGEFLKELGVTDFQYQGLRRNVVRISYRDTAGQEKAARYRVALQGDHKFLWKKGDKPFLYGLWRLGNGKVPKYIILVEGESDCHTLWFHGYPAIGLPGAATWNEVRDTAYFDDIETIFVIDERDTGAETVKKLIAKSSIRKRVQFFSLGKFKDPSDLHVNDLQAFKARFEEALKQSIPWAEVEAKRVTQIREEAWEKCKVLAKNPDILSEFAKEMPRIGFAGDTTPAKLLYLGLTSRIQQRPLSISIDGPSAGGKSFLVDCVRKFFPDDSYHIFTAMSERNLAYTDRDLKNRFLIIYELSGIADGLQNYLIRSLLSEGCIRYEFVEKTEKGLSSREIIKEGPTGLILTTTAVSLHPENETRLLSITISDSEEQTRKIIRALSKKSQDQVDFECWHALQTLLQYQQDVEIIIPYVEALGDLVNPVAIRLRRDYSALLTLIRAHAHLHHQTRERDDQGRIIATLGDYAAALGMIGPLISASTDSIVTNPVKEAVFAVEDIIKEQADASPTAQEIRVRLKKNGISIEPRSVRRRLKTALSKGYLKNVSSGKDGVPYQYRLADKLPEEVKIFPTPEELEGGGRVPGHPGVATCSPINSRSLGRVDTWTPILGGKHTHTCHDLIQVSSTVSPAILKEKKLFIDTETSGLDPHGDELLLIQIKAGDSVFVIDAAKADLSLVKKILEDAKVLKVFQNGIFDIKFLKKNLDCEVQNIFDTMIAERLLNAGIGTLRGCSLEVLALKYLGITLDKDLQTSFHFGANVTQDQINYAEKDVTVLSGIFEAQKKQLEAKGLVETAKLEFSIIPAMADIELKGILLDTAKLEDLKKNLEAQVLSLKDKLKEYGEINFSSPLQVIELLKGLGFKVESTDTKTLKAIDHPFTKLLVEYREASKLFTAFAKRLSTHINPSTGRIHPNFLQCGTATGRISCQRPNLQQIPREQVWRDLFIAPPGFKLITADYSQIELRILGEFSKDPGFVEAYKKKQDLHQRVADSLKISRDAAKTINFGIVYGMGPLGLSTRLGITKEEAEKFINAYFHAYPKVKRLLEDFEARPLNEGFTVTPLGRKRFFKDAETMKEHGEMKRQGRNTPIQSTCGDILKKAILLISEKLRGREAYIVNMIHDELLIECRDDIVEDTSKEISACMVEAGKEFIKTVPVEVNAMIDQRWRK